MGDAALEELTPEECLAFLRERAVGRLAVVAAQVPVVLPVNYRLVETLHRTWIAIRTRPGNVLDQAPTPAAFEIDDIDPLGHRGRSVLVRGELDRIDETVDAFREHFDSEPWIAEDRDAWLIIEPFTITGRRLTDRSEPGHDPGPDDPEGWAFHPSAYL